MSVKKEVVDRHRLFYTEFFKTHARKTVVVDAGARGDLEEPWRWLDESLLSIIGFDPDTAECERLSRLYPNRRYFPTALWSRDGTVDIRITKDVSCSSAYPPNMNLIERYEKKHWETKIVQKTESYPARTLDAVATEYGFAPDFLKLDTQGGEWDILTGAKRLLSESVFGVVAETWTTEMYAGAPTSERIIALMREHGFELFGINVASACKYAVTPPLNRGKQQITGLDFLFFKDLRSSSFFRDPGRLLICAAIAEIYGYPDYAVSLLAAGGGDAVLAEARRSIVQNAQRPSGIGARILRKLRKLAGYATIEYPSLHP